MRTIDLEDLMNTVEQLRQELHADLDADFLAEVVRAEEENQEDDAEALRRIGVALKAVLATKGIR